MAVSIPVPEGLSYFPFQVEGIQFALDHLGTLLADEMGIGKTIQAIGVINALPELKRVLIICPATMRGIWKRELEKWLVQPTRIAVFGIDTNASTKAVSCHILIVNYDRLGQALPLLRSIQWHLAIYDECHYLKNRESKRSKIAFSIRAARRIALSGTPLQNRPVELFGVLNWLDPDSWPVESYFEYGRRYCGARYNGFGWDLSGASHLTELNERLRASVMIRRTKAHVLPDLPPKLRSVVELEPDSNIQALVSAELWAFERWMAERSKECGNQVSDENGSGKYQAAVNGLRRFQGTAHENLAVARHETALAKVPLVVAFVTELLRGGTVKIVLFAHHRDVVAALSDSLVEFHPVTLTGGTSAKDRDLGINLFQNDSSVRVFIGNIVAAGVGITLAPASSQCIFAELSWVPSEITQAEDRLHRIGARDSVLIQHLVLAGSLDSVMVRRLMKKQEILDGVLESRI